MATVNEQFPDLEAQERDKYQRIWMFDQYRKNAPGEKLVQDAIERMGIRRGSTLLDFGCGTGRAVLAFRDQGIIAGGMDIAQNCLDQEVREAGIDFFERCLWEPIGLSADFGFCTDVMEHIPPERVHDVLRQIADSVRHCYFQIAIRPDGLGSLIGETLHLTVENADWWQRALGQHFEVEHFQQRNGGVIAICRS